MTILKSLYVTQFKQYVAPFTHSDTTCSVNFRNYFKWLFTKKSIIKSPYLNLWDIHQKK
jgi:hypothetical protein